MTQFINNIRTCYTLDSLHSLSIIGTVNWIQEDLREARRQLTDHKAQLHAEFKGKAAAEYSKKKSKTSFKSGKTLIHYEI